MEGATIGLDIPKRVLYVHAVDAQEQVTGRRRLRRGEIASFFSSLSPPAWLHGCDRGLRYSPLLGTRDSAVWT